MDSNAAFRDLLDALESCDWKETIELSMTLITWMERGGDPPLTVGEAILGDDWHRTIATFLCYAARTKATSEFRRQRRRASRV